MGAAWFRLRADLGRRWPSWAALALLTGLAGAVVLATAAGARRTDTAYPRFLESSYAADVLLAADQSGQDGYYDAVARLPEVRSTGVMVGLVAVVVTANGKPDSSTIVGGPGDIHLGVDIERPKLVAGRMFRPDRQDEAVIDQAAAEHLHLGIGSALPVHLFPNLDPPPDPTRDKPSLRLLAHVVGVIATRNSIVPPTEFDAQPLVLLTPAVVTAIGRKYAAFDGLYVRLRPGVSAALFEDHVQALAKQFPALGQQRYFVNEAQQAARVRRAVRPEAIALALFSLLTAVTAFFVIGQMASRQLYLASGDYPVLRALGMTRLQLLADALGKVGLTAACGAALAVVGAIAASPLMPIGAARLAEPDPGMSLDVTILGLGFVGIIALLLLGAAGPALRLASSPPQHRNAAVEFARINGPQRPSALAYCVRRVHTWPTAAVGLRMAAEPGHGRTAVPIRSTLTGTIIALTAVIAALTFGTNLNRLVTTPRLFGQTWDMALNMDFSRIPADQTSRQLGERHDVSAWTFGRYGTLTVGGQQVPTIGLDPGQGSLLFPTLLEGRAPADSDEMVLGTSTLKRLHQRLGGVVDVQVDGKPARLKIVGRAIFPAFSQGSFAATDLGEGAAVQAKVLAPASGESNDVYNFVLIRLTSGVDPFRTSARIAKSLCLQNDASGCLLTSQRPSGIKNYAWIQKTPLVLAAVLAVLAIATLVHLLATSTRRRRLDLAVLKTLGFVRRQVLEAVAWQASALAAVAVAIGIPAGIIAGRWAWIAFANRLGVDTELSVPLTVLIAIPAALLVANAAAFGPGLTAARGRPATTLRAE